MRYEWLPGTGIDDSALQRMRSNVSRPSEPMGEAWFMGENRKIYNELMEDVSALPCRKLEEILYEISSGTGSFGLLSEWEQWFNYLLPQLIPRTKYGHDRLRIGTLCTAFMQINMNGITKPHYPEYRTDSLQTLGRVLMDRSNWQDGRVIKGRILQVPVYPGGDALWSDVNEDLAASLSLALKFLEPEEIPSWIVSLFTIECPYWRAQITAWCIAMREFFRLDVRFPDELKKYPRLQWNNSFVLRGTHGGDQIADTFFPAENLAKAETAIRECWSKIDIDMWLLTILDEEELYKSVGYAIESFNPNE